MSTPDTQEARHTLMTAAARYDELRLRDALGDGDPGSTPLTREESLELLALGEVLARKAGYGRQLAVRAARSRGASWSQIGAALGTSKQSAWETHTRWIEDQAAANRRDGYGGMDPADEAAARALADEPD